MLNKNGFGLGSGHDKKELKKDYFKSGGSIERYYLLILNPYVGAPIQKIYFFEYKK